MRLPLPLNLVLTLMLAASAGGCGAAAPGGGQFDLVCHGTASGDHPGPFDVTVRADLAHNRFCTDDCGTILTFTQATPARLVFHYDVGAPGGPKPWGVANPKAGGFTTSSAGPWQQKDDLVIDRTTGAFRRDGIFDAGDPAARRFVVHQTATCHTAPYTPID